MTGEHAAGADGALRRRGGGPRPPGDARRLVLDAAFELLAERGIAGTSMDAVSERAGVSKATLYRHWPSKNELVLDAVRRLGRLGPLPTSQDPLADLLTVLEQFAAALATTPDGRLQPRLVAAAAEDPDLARIWRAEVVAQRRAGIATLVRRAIEAGRIPAETDVDVAVDVLVGPIVYRHLVSGASTTGLAAALVAIITTDVRG